VANRALFLDRDGIVNVDKGFVHKQADFDWMPGIFELVTTARDLDALLIIVTNQSGIARGLYTQETFQTLTDWMVKEFAKRNVPLTQVYHCPYLEGPDGKDHPLRKPNPGMLLAAQRDHDIDLARSSMLGDKWADVDAAIAAGVPSVGIVGERRTEWPNEPRYQHIARLNDLAAANKWLPGALG